MKTWQAWICLVAATLVVTASGAKATPLPSEQTSSTLPSPHLGYGINVHDQNHVDSLFGPMGFDWLKLWEEYTPVPTTRYPYRVLFLIDCYHRSGDLTEWEDDVRTIVTAGKGLVEAYEICNEPNRSEWLNKGVNPHNPPDPAHYVQMLQVAYETVKEIDPDATVVSAGLAPVGRIQGTCNGWDYNNCAAMDEREFASQMLHLGAGGYFDAFGYHPYGFAYPPETDPYSVSNGFAFRTAEVMHDFLEERGLEYKPIWATEFGWLRDPSYDPGYTGFIPGWCHRVPEYENNFGWMDVSETQQADYMVQAYQYADEHWPWMGAMFVWNLDWHNYNWLCEPARYFSVRKDNDTDPGSPALAYAALTEMEKRLGPFGPRLIVTPTVLSFQTKETEPRVFTGTITPLNAGYRLLTWTASVVPGMSLTPTLAITAGVQGTPLTVTVDSASYSAGIYTGTVTVTGVTTDVLDAPQTVTVTLHIEAVQPRLVVTPEALVFLADVDEPGSMAATLNLHNTGSGVITWTAVAAQGMQVTPTLPITTGLQETPLVVTVDSTGYAVGVYTGTITITATPPDTLGVPRFIPVTLAVAPEICRVHLPLTFHSAP
jgi:hypothetical protein